RQAAQVAGREGEHRLLAEEAGQALLELFVEGQGAGQEARAGAAGAEVVEGATRGLLQARVLREAEVVVRAGDDHLAAVDLDRPTVLRADRFEERVHPGGDGFVGSPELVSLGERITYRTAVRQGSIAARDL